MLKKSIWLVVATVFFAFQVLIGSAMAENLNEKTRTVSLNEEGETVTLTLKQEKLGKKLFGDVCAQCHGAGRTKTNPNVTLSKKDLSGAYPRRDNIEALIDYLKDPTTYDGEIEIYEFHPAIMSADIFPEMRNFTEDDLYDIAGYILTEINLRGNVWGAGKVYD